MSKPTYEELELVLRRLLDDPVYFYGCDYCGDSICDVCNAQLWRDDPHKPDCSWMNAQALLDRIDAAPKKPDPLKPVEYTAGSPKEVYIWSIMLGTAIAFYLLSAVFSAGR